MPVLYLQIDSFTNCLVFVTYNDTFLFTYESGGSYGEEAVVSILGCNAVWTCR
jgi:hypothetical protein